LTAGAPVCECCSSSSHRMRFSLSPVCNPPRVATSTPPPPPPPARTHNRVHDAPAPTVTAPRPRPRHPPAGRRLCHHPNQPAL
jgi:hypothetical protein